MDRARDERQSTDQEHQHQDGIKETGRLEIDVHVGNYAGQDKQRTAHGQYPAESASSIEEDDSEPEQHRDERNTERITAPEIPIRSHHVHLVGEEISSDASHGEADEEMP